MVQAILERRKTQTRRLIKPQPIIDEGSGSVFDGKHKKQYDIHRWKEPFIDAFSRWLPEDRLWVKETFGIDDFFKHKPKIILYKATQKIDFDYPIKWKPSIFMSKDVARIFLKIIDVRVERLNDISKVDAIEEGIRPEVTGDDLYENYANVGYRWIKAKESYKSLWESINGEGIWELNPWVWVISFKEA